MTTPRPYQIEGAKQIARFGGRALLADEPGLGKSLTSLLYLNNKPDLRPVVIVCPASVKFHWEKEAAIHFNLRAEILSTTSPPPEGLMPRHSIVVINYDILWPWMDYLKGLKAKAVILDECHYLCSRSTKRTKGVQELVKGVPHVVALSGTPLTNRPAELFPTINILRKDLFPSFMPYGMKWCGARRAPWGWEFKGATKLKSLHKLLKANLMIRRRKIDVLSELPPKQRFVIPLELPNYKEYKQALDDFVGWLIQNSPERMTGAVRAQALTKVGYLKRLAGKLKVPVVCSWVDDHLEESEGKLVLFGVHHEVIDQLEAKYKKQCVVLTGHTSEGNRKKAIEKFIANKSTRLFIGNMQAAGVGVDGLQVADTLAFFELGWKPGDHTQAEARIDRMGQKNASSCYYLIAKGTIEERLTEMIQSKQGNLNTVLDGERDAGDELDLRDQLIEQLYKEGKK